MLTEHQTNVATPTEPQWGQAPRVEREVRAADGELLMQFVRHRDDDAFSELVARHASMVLGVCTQILRDRFEAEDVFQATFLILAQKAHKIKMQQASSLAGWLHTVASRAALRAAKQKPRCGDQMVNIESSESDQWLQIAQQEEQTTLHEELNRLPAPYRDALVLCYLEGKTQVEAAEVLECKEDAIQYRVVRGKRMLRSRLARRGIMASTVLTASALSASACESAEVSSLISLTSETCAATVLHGDSSIFATNIGSIAQQGVISMKLVSTMGAIAIAAIMVATSVVLAGLGDASAAGGESASPRLNVYPALDTSKLVAADAKVVASDESRKTPKSAEAEPIKVGEIPSKLIHYVDVKMDAGEVNKKLPAGHFVHDQTGLEKVWAELEQPKEKLPKVDFTKHLVALKHRNAGDDNFWDLRCKVDSTGAATFHGFMTQRGYRNSPLHRVSFYAIPRATIETFHGVKVPPNDVATDKTSDATKKENSIAFVYEASGGIGATSVKLTVYSDFTYLASVSGRERGRGKSLNPDQRVRLSKLLKTFGTLEYLEDTTRTLRDGGRTLIKIIGTGKQTTLAKPKSPISMTEISQYLEIQMLAEELVWGKKSGELNSRLFDGTFTDDWDEVSVMPNHVFVTVDEW